MKPEVVGTLGVKLNLKRNHFVNVRFIKSILGKLSWEKER